jgi:hypothetical protein
MARRSRGQVMSCVICTVHMEMKSTDFLVEPQNQDRWFFGLCLKTDSFDLVIWVSKSSRRFLSLGLKNMWDSVWWLHHKINGGRLARDTRRHVAACFAWKQVGLGFSSMTLRLLEAWWRMIHVASSRRLHRDEAEDGRVDAMRCVGTFYQKIIVFYILGHRAI